MQLRMKTTATLLLDHQSKFLTRITKYVRFLAITNAMKIIRVAKIIASSKLYQTKKSRSTQVSLKNSMKKRVSRDNSVKIFEQSTFIQQSVKKEKRYEYQDGVEIVTNEKEQKRQNFSLAKTVKTDLNEVLENLKRPSFSSINNSPLKNNFFENEQTSLRVPMPKIFEESEALSQSEIDKQTYKELKANNQVKVTISKESEMNALVMTKQITSRENLSNQNVVNEEQTETTKKNLSLQKEANLRLERQLVTSIINKVVTLTMIFIIILSITNEEFIKDLQNTTIPEAKEYCLNQMKNSLTKMKTDENEFTIFKIIFNKCYNYEDFSYVNILHADFSNVEELKIKGENQFPHLYFKDDYEQITTTYRENSDFFVVSVYVEQESYFVITFSQVNKLSVTYICYLIQSFAISVILVIFAYLFSSDITHMVISPLDHLISRVNYYFIEKNKLRESLSHMNLVKQEIYFVEFSIRRFLKLTIATTGKQGLIISSLSIYSKFRSEL